ncbi:S-adenosyl-L-methionine-dependent methyltransferase [Terfezia boudieri ATCC MYA-4762]|uniref:S-adenosyl-L-methionine-dependent methyltransferase n=1 Tax=Terfezia boudieri ATCC MYA-4762 TaxID=1051890 RepID=A0A3N4LAF5_9PEZI|nr:S-adenosyl-L-methionine-dependent methyltransferase [Terfezia boudieri ATCC MYA-4762]
MSTDSPIAQAKDIWDSKTYSQKVAPYVPALTTRIVGMLDPREEDHILDLGCGDGVLTSQISALVSSIVGIDASANMISAANANYSTSNSTYLTIDAVSITCPKIQSTITSHLSPSTTLQFTKIFSNAALHWILRPLTPDSTTRDITPLVNFFRACYDLLAPGGTFVSESGAQGNVAEVHTALISALIHRGVPPAEARDASPWLFPSKGLMSTALTRAGFVVDHIETEHRPTEAMEADIQSWVRLFGAPFLDKLEEFVNARDGGNGEKGQQAREDAVREVAEAVERVGRRPEDGEFVIGYVRLRFQARKPE